MRGREVKIMAEKQPNHDQNMSKVEPATTQPIGRGAVVGVVGGVFMGTFPSTPEDQTTQAEAINNIRTHRS